MIAGQKGNRAAPDSPRQSIDNHPLGRLTTIGKYCSAQMSWLRVGVCGMSPGI
jgi:hypothetical protein